jgi:ribosomal protein S18 acetylase RimI-like enzyme
MMGEIWMSDITEKNVRHVHLLNCSLFPIRYDPKFYVEILKSNGLTKLVYYGNPNMNEELLTPVGTLCCRKEQINSLKSLLQDFPPSNDMNILSLSNQKSDIPSYRIYIMTLGVLASYRRLGIGTALLKYVFDYCAKDTTIQGIYLHVQTNNTEALKFYEKFGFEIINTSKDYYRNIFPSDAYKLYRPFMRM